MTLDFGKYKGRKVDDIAKIDIDYLIWILENIKAKKHKKLIDHIFDLIGDTEYYETHNEMRRLEWMVDCGAGLMYTQF